MTAVGLNASSWSGAEYRALLRLAWPAMLTQIGLMLGGVFDTLMLARVNVDALAASALAGMWQWSFMSIGVGAVMGIDPLISQAHGRGDGPATTLALQRGLVIALLVSVPLCVCQALTGPGLRLLGQPAHVAQLAQQYNLLKLSTIPCFLAFTALRQYLQGRGLLAPAVLATYFATAANGVLGWALIFGHLGAPALGLLGAAIADSLTSLLLVLGLWIAVRALAPQQSAARRWDKESVSLHGLMQTLRLGLPIGMQMSLEAWAFTLATFMAGWIGVLAIGSHQIVLNMAALSFMVPLGISMGAATRVGNLIGEGDEPGLRRAVRASLSLGAGVMVFAATAFTVLRHELPRLYSDDPGLVPLASQILPVAAAFQLADGTQAVAGGVLRGMGRPQVAALINLLGYYVLALPLAYLLAFRMGLGLLGIWLALAVGLLAVAGSLLFWIRRTARTPIAELQLRVSGASTLVPPSPAEPTSVAR
jgi:MATE family multidrug resistance protein